MKKCFLSFFLLLLSSLLFSEFVGIFNTGITLETNEIMRYSKPMPSFGLDMHGISSSSGFTLFWNNTFSYAKKDLQFVSSELLLGGTFLRDKALNISFGLGGRFAMPLNMQKELQEQGEHILPGFGGTLGISYYFNDSFGFSLFVSDFASFAYNTKGDNKDDSKNGKLFYEGVSDGFCFKIGMNIRLGGKLDSSYDESDSEDNSSL